MWPVSPKPVAGVEGGGDGVGCHPDWLISPPGGPWSSVGGDEGEGWATGCRGRGGDSVAMAVWRRGGEASSRDPGPGRASESLSSHVPLLSWPSRVGWGSFSHVRDLIGNVSTPWTSSPPPL